VRFSSGAQYVIQHSAKNGENMPVWLMKLVLAQLSIIAQVAVAK